MVDDGTSKYAVRRCLVCGEILDLIDQALHRTKHQGSGK